MRIRKTTLSDLPEVMSLIHEAQATIADLGIDQWQNGYPSAPVIEADIQKGQSYCVELDGQVCATFVLMRDQEHDYDRIYEGHWLTADDSLDYITLHRMAIRVSHRGQGLSDAIIDYARRLAGELGRSIRVDTHKGNVRMRRLLQKQGFAYCGVVYMPNGDPRVAYELTVSMNR